MVKGKYYVGDHNWFKNSYRSKKKRRENEEEYILQDHGTVSGEALSFNSDHRIKKSKKEKRPKAESWRPCQDPYCNFIVLG